MCILDRDKTGETVCGIPVTASSNSLLDYLCDKWVEEIFFSIPVNASYPLALIDRIPGSSAAKNARMERLKRESEILSGITA